MSACDPRPGCPLCGEKDELLLETRADGYGLIVTCLRCGWTDWHHESVTDTEARAFSASPSRGGGGAKEKP